ncbi:MAG: aminodeoxychorismate synthase component I [Chloroflexi bacterium]|nr:aminodeoxychorismate synthase component I [Chloroflexota bacterium]
MVGRTTGVHALVEEQKLSSSPVEVFSRFAADPHSIFLDSAAGTGRLGRYSFIVVDPPVTLRSKADLIQICRDGTIESHHGDPFEALRQLLQEFAVEPVPGLPFLGGAVGYFAYDLNHFVEVVPGKAEDDLLLPEMYVGLYDVALAFDHQSGKTYLVSTGYPETRETERQLRTLQRMDWLRSRLSEDCRSNVAHREVFALGHFLSDPEATFTQDGYEWAVDRVKEYIARGDVYQVNLSQRFSVPLSVSPWELYHRLRRVNPAPFSAYLNFEDIVVASSSPERFLRLADGLIETRPIKGTRPRGETPGLDRALAQELRSSPKDRAENVMIVDLLRNDLGRVAEIGSVSVPELVLLEEFATVFHLVSTVTGRLRPDCDNIDLLKACWPGGSITGAPKIRAMEIIDELEPTRRGIYCGSIGYLSFSGSMDTSIVIRTIVIKDGVAHFQVGGGVVIDSDPSAEYRETLDKAQGLIRALDGGKHERPWTPSSRGLTVP